MIEIPKYLSDWINIIENMNTDNTYKIVWGRAILECIYHDDYITNNKVIISLESIAHNIIKYYWNQIFFFNLKQSPHINREPTVCVEVKKLIERYKAITNSNIPIWYDKGIDIVKKNDIEFFKDIHIKITKTLRLDVAYRFKNVPNNILEIYDYKKNDYVIYLELSNVILLKEFNIILAELLNFKWSQLLEKYNHHPKISSKVKGTASMQLSRNSLSVYKKLLLSQFKDGKIIDFYTNNELQLANVSIDHVIPWSFIYSDDIWNLVITSKSYNSTKSNSVPTKDVIERLKKRNKELLSIIDDKSKKEDLINAIENNLVDKFYYDFIN